MNRQDAKDAKATVRREGQSAHGLSLPSDRYLGALGALAVDWPDIYEFWILDSEFCQL